MASEQQTRAFERSIPDQGPILLLPADGEGRGLILDVNVCPFPGCPERHVIVDGFLVESGDGHAPEEREAEWAFVVSVDVDEPGAVHLEKCHDHVALGWFRGALDAELRAALRRRFELERERCDAVLRAGGTARQEGSSVALTRGRSGWSAMAITPEQVVAVLASMARGGPAGGQSRAWTRGGQPRARRAGRNDPCPCGSGRKYKRCCLGSA